MAQTNQFMELVNDVVRKHRKELEHWTIPEPRLRILKNLKEELKVLKETWEMVGDNNMSTFVDSVIAVDNF